MNQTLKPIWEKSLKEIQKELHALSFTTWFDNLKPAAMKDDKFYIAIPKDSAFNKSILENRYQNLTNNALSQVTQKEMQAVFIVDGDPITSLDTEPFQNDIAVKETSLGVTYSYKGPQIFTGSNLNPRYSFEHFVIGENNRFAHAASVAVAEFPAERYNPLFIHGGVGLGKTHLMQAIGKHINESMPNKKVMYITCETFTNDFIDSIQNKTGEAFRNKYRNVDVLLIDDIQFIAGKEGTQTEFFHTFNKLQEQNKQIVITSDRPPKEIPNLTERLRSRFEMGLTTDISAPNLETRIAILKMKAELNPETIPDDVLHFIADNVHSNIRELEGALTTAVAYASLNNQPINLENTKIALKELSANTKKTIDAAYIKDVTSKYYNITVEEMDSKSRKKTISQPRQVAMYLIRELTDMSLPKIGEAFGGRDHTTVLHGCQKVKEEISKNTDFHNLVIRITKEITE